MKKLFRSFIGTTPGILVLVVAIGTPVASQFSGLMLPAATGEEVDLVQLDEWKFEARWPTGANSNVPLIAGKQYRVEIKGAFSPYGSAVDGQHDAECGWSTTTPPTRSDEADETGVTPDVYIGAGADDPDGFEVDWVPTTESPAGSGCNKDNWTYKVFYTPTTTGTVNLRVHELELGGYNDNGTNEFTAHLFTAQASDPSNPLGGVDELQGEVEGTVTGAVGDAEATARDALAENGIDPDDPEGTVARLVAEAGDPEAEAEAKQQEAEAKQQQLEDTAPDPDPNEVSEDAEQFLEENDPGEPGDPGDVDTGPATEAVGAVLDEVEKNTPGDDTEPPSEVTDVADAAEQAAEDAAGSDVPDPVGALGDGGGGETPTTTSPTTTPTTSPTTTPTTSPTTTPTTTPPPSNGSGGGGSGSGETAAGTGGTTGSSNGASDPGTPASSAGGGFQVSEIAAPTATDGGNGGNTVNAGTPAAAVKGKRVSAESGAAPAAEPTADGLAVTEFAIAGLDDVDPVSEDEPLARPRPLAPSTPKQGNQMLLGLVALGVLFGTFEMGRRAFQRIRAERAYDTYGY